MEMKAKKSVLMAVCAAFALAGQAAVVIKFDGATANALTGSQQNLGVFNAQTNAPGTTFTSSLAYSTTVAKFEPGVPSAKYTGQKIYGGHYLMWSNSTANTVISRGGAPLAYRDGAQGISTVENLAFVTGGDTALKRMQNFAILFEINMPGSYGFDATSTLSVNFSYWALPTATYTNRWVVVADGVTYVSEPQIGLGKRGVSEGVVITIDNPDAINWAVWNPGADMSFGSLAFNVVGSMITNITHAGIAENQFLDSGETTRNVYVYGFETNLNP